MGPSFKSKHEADPNELPVCAVIVTHNPGHDLSGLLGVLHDQVERVIVVDNASRMSELQSLLELDASPSVTIHTNAANLGLASALNQGCAIALDEGYQWILTLDQDSEPTPGMVRAQLDVFRQKADIDPIAIVAPAIEDKSISYRYRSLTARNRWLFRRVACNGSVIEEVLMVFNSGALHHAPAYRAIGGFRDDFFIDYIDTEYCLRARQHGYRVLVACQARIQHRLGNRQRRKIGPLTFLPTFHSPLRWYYISRNRIPMLRAYSRRFPNWFFFELLSSVYILIRMLIFEDQRRFKLQALLMGTIDGLKRRMGKIAPTVAHRLGDLDTG